jgi:hypothetical protein
MCNSSALNFDAGNCFKFLWGSASIVCVFSSSASGASLPELTGVWKPVSSDDRLMTIKQEQGTITIEARDLRCSLTDVQPSPTDGPNAIVANGECFAEGNELHAKETLTIMGVGRDLLLIEAIVTIRWINENEEPKVDETYTNKPATIRVCSDDVPVPGSHVPCWLPELPHDLSVLAGSTRV